VSPRQGSLLGRVQFRVSIKSWRKIHPAARRGGREEQCLLHLPDSQTHVINDKTRLKTNYRDTEKGQIPAGSHGEQ